MAKRILSQFDKVYEEVMVPHFKSIADDRQGNLSYSLVDVLKSGFAIYSLKCASLFSFRERCQMEDENIQRVYGIEKIPSDNGIRKILDNISSSELRKGFHKLFNYVKKEKQLDNFKFWKNHYVVSVDGVEHFCSNTVHCDKCMSRTHRDGSTTFYHSMLSAAIVHPDQKEVFILDNEPIIKQDGVAKNDCEINAAKRLIPSLKELYSNELMIFTFDGLYACNPIVTQFNDCPNWKYIISIKEDGNKHLFNQFDKKNEAHKAKWLTEKSTKNKATKIKAGSREFGYINDLELNASSPDTKVNMLYYIWTDEKGKDTIFTWITNIELTKENLFDVMKMGRSRWKIENETFNTLKNQGYNFSHNFGHGENELCTVFAYLMMMAFYLDQIQQHSCKYFKKILERVKTKIKFWESMKAVFKILPIKNMADMLICVADMYQVRLI